MDSGHAQVRYIKLEGHEKSHGLHPKCAQTSGRCHSSWNAVPSQRAG